MVGSPGLGWGGIGWAAGGGPPAGWGGIGWPSKSHNRYMSLRKLLELLSALLDERSGHPRCAYIIIYK